MSSHLAGSFTGRCVRSTTLHSKNANSRPSHRLARRHLKPTGWAVNPASLPSSASARCADLLHCVCAQTEQGLRRDFDSSSTSPSTILRFLRLVCRACGRGKERVHPFMCVRIRKSVIKELSVSDVCLCAYDLSQKRFFMNFAWSQVLASGYVAWRRFTRSACLLARV